MYCFINHSEIEITNIMLLNNSMLIFKNKNRNLFIKIYSYSSILLFHKFEHEGANSGTIKR